ncbi:MAG TPA: geranylgeranylglyceryl/heptaprenylglyceryl phosphate synthase [Bacteroides sp.]|nr:geranylgeranylglyceryl/heptaprenylglyceryl phosphate synthase [Bacteroides sp.]
MIYSSILDKLKTGKLFSLLVDPDKHDRNSLRAIGETASPETVDFILVGGSLVSGSVDETVSMLKESTNLPVILFPGNVLQISPLADGILLLSLISGRNPEFLIGNHVIAAPVLRKTELEIIPTGYILVENGRTTSVEYMSNTKPIPSDKIDLAVATAIAGEMLGHKLIYLEAGSGAKENINAGMIREIRLQISIPLIVGGGIHTPDQIRETYKAGADIIVVGSAIEKGSGEMAGLLNSIWKIRQESF